MHGVTLLAAFAGLVTSIEHDYSQPEKYDFRNLPADHIVWGDKRDSRVDKVLEPRAADDGACVNGPTSRACWANGFSIATDFDQKWPNTGVTKEYTLTATNTTCDQDGSGSRNCFLFNNQFPGPTIYADWGDMIKITVVNQLQDNGTSIHWHGIRQLNSNAMDGVNGITECPIAPGQSATYLFQATQHGTSWYHSHHTVQYAMGLSGAIVINGPASDNYDVDLGPVSLSDLWYTPAYQVNAQIMQDLQTVTFPPGSDNLLINGRNKNTQNGQGSYSQLTCPEGSKCLLRLVNPSADNNLRFSIDNHVLEIISADFVPIKPIYADSVMLAVGQRYSVIVHANQTAGNFWMRTTAEADCQSGSAGTGLAVFSYTGSTSNPTTQSTATDSGCVDPGVLSPYVTNVVGSVDLFKQQAKELPLDLVTQEQSTSNGQNIVVWGLNMTGIDVMWEKPTLQYVMTANASYPNTANLIELPEQGTWAFYIIQEVATIKIPVAHPIHLHGHDFYVLGSGHGQFDLQNGPNSLNYDNPPRRDTAILPAQGYLVLAFPMDNPGAWLMHCHLAWHISEGFGLQFLESKEKIQLPGAEFTNQCNAWQDYYKTAKYLKDDSGL